MLPTSELDARHEVFSVKSSVSPMYGPFQSSQNLDLLELELRWESTDVVVNAQVLVFGQAQLVGAICAVLACAHLARAVVQRIVKKGVRAAGRCFCGRDPFLPGGPRGRHVDAAERGDQLL
jgi:hypothetical protein